MTNLEIIKKLQQKIKEKPHEYQALEDLFEMLRIYEKENHELAHIWNKDVRRISAQQVKLAKTDSSAEKFYYLNKRSLLFDAKIDFDAYLQYVEFDREPEKRFYLPRRKQILPIVQALQELEDDKLDLLGISMPPGTGKSTLGIFFLTWIMGKYPDKPNLASAHSDKLTRSFYDGVLSIIADPEYLWADVFPGIKIARTNSKDETIDLEKQKRFATLTCRSIDGSLTGATRCEKYLYADDMKGIKPAPSSPGTIAVGSTVTVNGRLYATSAGAGPGKTLSNYTGKVSIIKPGAKYPYHIATPSGGALGWVSAGTIGASAPPSQPSQPAPPSLGTIAVGSVVTVNGRLYRTSAGEDPGKTLSNYTGKVSIINPGAKYPYHISTPNDGPLGWVDAKSIDVSSQPVLPPKQIEVGSIVIVNGRLHTTAAGAGPGKKLADHKAKVNIIKSGMSYPYHVTTLAGNPLGWVSADSVKLA